MTPEEIMAAAEHHSKADWSQPRTIAAGDVLPDDLIYDGSGKWIRVVEMRPFDSNYVDIETVNWTTNKHKREAITVKRGEWE